MFTLHFVKTQEIIVLNWPEKIPYMLTVGVSLNVESRFSDQCTNFNAL